MREDGAALKDRTPTVTPAILCNHPDDVATVDPLDSHRFQVSFIDGTEGTVDMSSLIDSENAGVFASLRDPAVFRSVFVQYGAVTWPGEIDLAPDAMYAEIKANGAWKL
jgi:hypothetical protein